MSTLDIDERPLVSCGNGVVELAPPSLITVRLGDDAVTRDLPDLQSSSLVTVQCHRGRLFALGEKSAVVWVADPHALTVRETARLDRLDYEGRYDPGGMHRIEFHELGDGDLLVEFELGVARLSAGGDLRWQRVHDDVTARVVTIGPNDVVLKAESDTLVVRLTDGTVALR